VRVDLAKADKIKKDLQKKEDFLLFQIKKDTGVDVDIWAAVRYRRDSHRTVLIQ
jgi:hypothetical protein